MSTRAAATTALRFKDACSSALRCSLRPRYAALRVLEPRGRPWLLLELLRRKTSVGWFDRGGLLIINHQHSSNGNDDNG